MKGQKIFIMWICALLLTGIFSPLVAGENDSLHVVMTMGNRKYSVGETITIQLRIYDKGVLTDLAAVQDAYLGMSTNHALQNPVNITLSGQGTGTYQGQYTVRDADRNRNLYFFYQVTLGNDREEGSAAVWAHSIQDAVDVTIGGQSEVPAKPGDSLMARILVRTGETPISINGFNHLYLEAPDGTRQNLTHTISDVGIFDVNVIVPAVSVSGTYELVASPMDIDDWDSAIIHVNVLDVWYRKVSTAGTTVSFEICVANNEGVPVEGANFYIRRENWPRDEYTGVTNASGRYMVHVPDIYGVVGFTGHVLAGGLNQSIMGSVINRVAQEPHHNDFDIVWEGGQKIFKPNDQVTIPYAAYDARVPATSRAIHYYVTARGTDFTLLGDTDSHAREVIAAGSVTTDSLGRFSIAFKTPAKQCAIDIRLEVPLDRSDFPDQVYDLDDDKYYAEWPPNQWDNEGFLFHAYEGKLDGDKGVTLKVSKFKPGEPGQVTITTKSELGDPLYASWAVGEASLEDMGSHDPEWMRWVPGGDRILLQIDEKGKYQGEFVLPTFISGQKVTVAAGYVDSQGIPHFDVRTVSPGGSPWAWVAIVIIILVIVAGVIVAKKKMLF